MGRKENGGRKRPFPITPGEPLGDETTFKLFYDIDQGSTSTFIVGETVFLNDEGIQVLASLDGSYQDQNAYTIIDSENQDIGGLYGRDDPGQNIISVRAVDPPANGDDVYLEIVATAEPSGSATAAAELVLQANRSGETTDTYIHLKVDDNESEIGIYTDNNIGRVRIRPKINLIGSSLEVCDVYLKGTNFIIKYNDSGTTRYKYLNLSGTGTTWTHSTSEP